MLVKAAGQEISRRSLATPIDAVVDSFVKTKRSVHTQRAYTNDISAFIKGVHIRTLSDMARYEFPEMVDAVRIYLDAHTKRDSGSGRVLNPKTVNRKAYAVSSFFRYLIDVYGYPKNPVATFQAHKVKRHSTTDSLTRAELGEVLQLAKSKHTKSHTAFRNYVALCFLSVLALRRSELVGIMWSDISYENSSIDVHQKGGSYKLLPIPAPLMTLLNAYRYKYEDDISYIFHPVRNNATGELNKPLNTSYIYELVGKLVIQCFPGRRITPHSFRKTFIEMALNNNEDFISIINATGQATVEMVKYYDTRDRLKNNAIHGMSGLV
jgi:integrase/recombinase XerD